MILQRLVDCYDRLSTDPVAGNKLPKPGYSVQRISFCVALSPDGKLNSFQSMLEEVGKSVVARQLLVPGQSKPTGSGLNPCFLWDNSAYMLGFKADDPKPERTHEAFEKFRARHLELEAEIADPSFSAVCTFLKTWTVDQAAEHLIALTKIASHFGVFKVAGVHGYVHDEPKVVNYWAGQGDSETAIACSKIGMCLVSGSRGPITTLHEPKIKGVSGAQSSGALLVSFNSDAYESFGKEQGDNAPVSLAAAFKYTNALNYLLNDRHRRTQIGDATVVFWADRPTLLEDVAEVIFGDLPAPKPDAPPEDMVRVQQVKVFLSQLREGQANSSAFSSDSEVGFYVLGLSPNASRISIRFWEQSTVAQMQQRLAQHLQDMNLIGGRPDDPPMVIRRIVQAAGRAEFTGGTFKGYDADAVPPLLSGALARAVFQGTPYPAMLLGQMLNRIRADGHVSHVRVAAIKACLVRKSRSVGRTSSITPSLNSECVDIPYVAGRTLAILEKLQSDSSGGGINSTVKDRYFSAASATPASIFPAILRLNQHYLAKLKDEKQQSWTQLLLDRVTAKVNAWPTSHNLEEQGLFTIGYFHQHEEFYRKRSNKGGLE